MAAALFTWPLALHPGSLFGAEDPGGDPSLYLWTLGWDFHTISTHPLWLLTGRVFNANIFAPAARTLAYSDHLLLQALVLWPFYAVTHNLVLCYNLLLVASLVAAAVAMHMLAREIAGSERAAYAAGLIFGFAPYHFTHLMHIQLQAMYFLPLSFLFLHRVFERERRTDTIALGLVMGLQPLSSAYYGIIGGIGIAAAGVALAVWMRRLSDWRLVSRAITAAAIALMVALPWSIPYLRVEQEAAAGRNLFEAARASAVPASYLQAPVTNLLYGRTGWLRPGPGQRLPRKDSPEQALFPGFAAMALAAVGLFASRPPFRKAALVYLIVGIVGFVLSMGPNGIRPLYSALYYGMFGMEAIRAAARFSVLALLAISVLAALGIRFLEVRLPVRLKPDTTYATTTILAIALIALEFLNGSIAYPQPPRLVSEAGRWLAAQPGSSAVICLPMGIDKTNTPCMLQSLEHWRPIMNGYSGIRPPFFPAVVEVMSQMPSADALLALHDLGVEYVVADRPLAVLPPGGSPSGRAVVERARFSDQTVYQLTWSPEIAAAIEAETTPAPPEPGPPGFAVGESATYEVRWTSGPVDLPAGEMTLDVAAPHGSGAFRFVASAKTAPWVARFFEAEAQLETTVDARLLPLAHAETIVEGKRRVERQLAFDFDRRQVRMTTGGASVTLPLAAAARDPMAALFYIRTLALAPGSDRSLPLTDNGRPSRLEVIVGSRETVVVHGQPRSAWKVEPRLHERLEREGRLTMSAWISADERRIPLVIDIAGTFGTVRAELISYRQD